MMNYKVLLNKQIDDDLFAKMLKLDQKIFPKEEGNALDPNYIKSLYQDDKEGLIFILDNDRLIAYMTMIWIDIQQLNHYLVDNNYRNLHNIHYQKGNDNIMYIYTIACDKEYQGQGIMKILGKYFVNYLNDLEIKGITHTIIISEAVSISGVKALKGFKMEAYKTDNEGLGLYISKDNLKMYKNDYL